MRVPSAPAPSGGRERRSNSLQLSFRSTSSRVKASEQGSQGVEAPSRNITQIKRLTYLLDAQEAKVQAVLDEAMSWLIVPFSSIPDDTDPEPRKAAEGARNGNKFPDSSSLETVLKVQGDAGAVGPNTGFLNLSPESNTSLDAPGQMRPDALGMSLSKGEEVVIGSEGIKAKNNGEAACFRENKCPLEMKGSPNGTVIDFTDQSLSKCIHHAHVEPMEVTKSPAARDEKYPPLGKKTADVATDSEVLHESFSFPSMTFTTEELEKLDAEAAWDELDADDELHANDYAFSLSLLPQLLVDSPPTLSSESVPVRPVPHQGSAISSAAQASAPAEVASASLDSPKRKRGRPKGSGRKLKGRLDTTAAVPLASGRGTSQESSVSVDANPPRRRQASPGFPLYDSQSPGSSALTNSPSSQWAGCGTDTFPSLTDLTDATTDTSSQSLSSLAFASPDTPSSVASPVLRSFSTASSAASAGVQEDEGAVATVLSSSALPAATSRNARATSGNHARRLAFCPEDDEMEDAPISPVMGLKTSQRGTTVRPRGRPRKTLSQQRARFIVED